MWRARAFGRKVQEIPLYRRRTPPVEDSLDLRSKFSRRSKRGSTLADLALPPKIQSIMAEFISAIVGLLAAGAKVSGSIYTLIDTLKDAPNELLALSNELTDFQLILSRVIEVRESGELSVEDEIPDGGFDILIERSKKILQDVENLVQEVIKQQCGKSKGSQVNRIKWLRRAKKAKKLKNSLQAQKSSLCSWIIVVML